jgi:hypothetical protein
MVLCTTIKSSLLQIPNSWVSEQDKDLLFISHQIDVCVEHIVVPKELADFQKSKIIEK